MDNKASAALKQGEHHEAVSAPTPGEEVSRRGAATHGEHRKADSTANANTSPAIVRRLNLRRLLIGGTLLLGLAGAAFWLAPLVRMALTTVSTDDAYVNGHVTFVASRVTGQVARVLVDDNYRVRKGDLLVELDKEP